MRIPQGAHAAPKSTPQPGSPFGGAGLTPVATPKQTCQPAHPGGPWRYAQPRQAGGTGGTAAYRPWAGGPRPSGATARGPRRPGQGTESTDRLPAFGTSAPWRDAQGSTSCRTRDRADEEPAGRTARAGRPATAAPHAPASGRGTGQTRGSSHRAAARRTAVAPARCSTPRGSCDPTRQAHSLLGGRIGTVAATSVGDHAGMLLGRWETIRTLAGQLWSASYFAGPWVVHRWTSCAPTSTARTGQPDPPSKSAASLRHHPEGQHTLG